jgi:hypothetical protein
MSIHIVSISHISALQTTVYGEQYADSILEAVRRCAEPCDSLQVRYLSIQFPLSATHTV